MLSITAIRGDGTYYTSLGRDDYLLHGGEPRGIWLGDGARTLGLAGIVDDPVYRRVLGGFSPDGSMALVRNAGTEHRRPGWDLTFSAPKSVSELWAVSRSVPEVERAIREAHWNAVRRAVRYLEEVAGETREGLGGHTRSAVRLVVAGFEHGTSRNQDPQLHSHCVVANVGVTLDGQTRAIVSRSLYRQKMTAGVLYRAELASQLRQRLGLDLVAKSSWFEVAGVPQSLMDAGSTRRQEIVAALEATGFSGAKAAKITALKTREAKTVVPREQLFERWEKIAAEHGFGYEQVRQLIHPGLEPAATPPGAVRSAIESILNRQSFFSERELIRRVAELVQHLGVPVDQIVASTRDALNHLVPLGVHQREPQFSDRATLELERKLIADAVAGREDSQHTLSAAIVDAVLAKNSLSGEQQAALRHITLRPGSIQIVQGLAGTGKSTLLAAAREAFEIDGFQVLGCSLSGKAAQGLQEASGIPSHTIARILQQWDRELSDVPRLHARSVLVVDEAAMVGTRQLASLLQHSQTARARVILVGDTRQLPAIAAGAPFGSLSRFLGMAELVDIRRQLANWGRMMVRNFADGDVREGVELLRERGLIHIGDNPEATTRQLLTEWSNETDLENVLILAGTHEEVRWLNQSAQELRRAAGRVGPLASRIGKEEFFVGDRVIFGKNDRKLGVRNGTFGTLTGERQGSAVVRLDRDQGTVFVPLNHEHVRLGYAVTTHKAQGATVNRAFVLFSDTMQSRESTYVQVSRARESTRLFMSRDQAGDAELTEAVRAMERLQAKLNATDLLNEVAGIAPQPSPGERLRGIHPSP